MKRIGIISTSALFLVVGLTAPAFAQQDDHKDQGKPAQEQQAKPEEQHQQTQQAKPAPEQQAKPQEQHQQAQQAKPAQPEHTQQAKEAKPVQETKPQQQQKAQQTQAKPQQQAHTQQAKQPKPAQQQQHVVRTSAQQERQRSIPALRLSVRGNSRIPDDRYRASFGAQHRFVISQPVMVGGYSRFQYSGFWFGFVQPWPVAWYYTDDVYVDYIDGGYYLYNPSYPGTRISISVVL